MFVVLRLMTSGVIDCWSISSWLTLSFLSSGQPYPDPSVTKYTWPTEMALRSDLASSALPTAVSNGTAVPEVATLKRVPPVVVDTIWESIDAGIDASVVSQHSAKSAVAASSSGSASSSKDSGVSYSTCFQGF